MASDLFSTDNPEHDEWLEAQCKRLEAAGNELANTVGAINHRLEGDIGKARRRNSGRPRVEPGEILKAQEVCSIFKEIQQGVQDALFDAEYDMRELRDRDVNPAQLLIEGNDLLRRYRFLRRRARICDSLLAYLPHVEESAHVCLDKLKLLEDSEMRFEPITVPDCGFALIAIEELQEAEQRP